MRRWVLSKKDRKKLARSLSECYPRFSLKNYDKVEVIVEGSTRIYMLDGIPAFIEDPALGTKPIPHLVFLLRRGYEWLPAITVDEGAVRPISRGADLMRPGIVDIRGAFAKGEVVVVAEPNRGLPIAVHEALYSSEEIREMEKGRVSRSLHHIGDRFWKLAEGA